MSNDMRQKLTFLMTNKFPKKEKEKKYLKMI